MIYPIMIYFCQDRLYSFKMVKSESNRVGESDTINDDYYGIDISSGERVDWEKPCSHLNIILEDDNIVFQNQRNHGEVFLFVDHGATAWIYVRILAKTSVKIPRNDLSGGLYLEAYLSNVTKKASVTVTCPEIHVHVPPESEFVMSEAVENRICNSCCSLLENSKGLVCTHCNTYILCLPCYYAAQIHTNIKRGEVIIKEKCNGELWWKKEDTNTFKSSKQNTVVRLITQRYMSETIDGVPPQ